LSTSGTATFNPSIWEYAEEAAERVGQELKSGYQLASARRSLNLLTADLGNRGINLWALDNQSQVLTPGTATYTLPDDTIDMLDAVIRTTTGGIQTDYVIARIGVGQFNSIPNKLSQARPLQYFVQRVVPPTVTLWPVPDATLSWTLVYWRLRRIQDTGSGGTNTMDIPFRFVPAVVSGLAYFMSLKSQDQAYTGMFGSQRITLFKQQYMEDLQNAMEEDRDRSSLFIVPSPTAYR